MPEKNSSPSPAKQSFDKKFSLALTAQNAGRSQEAWDNYKQALSVYRDFRAAWNNVALLADGFKKHDAAVAMALRARSCSDAGAGIHPTLMRALKSADRLVEAAQIAALDPKSSTLSASNIIETLRSQGHLEEIEKLFLADRDLTTIPPGEAFALAQVMLGLGHYAEGFELFNRRWDIQSYASTKRRFDNQWKGEDISGRKIAIFGEMGLGDMVFSLRYIACLRAANPASITCVASPPLLAFMRATGLFDEVIAKKSFTESTVDFVAYDTDVIATFLPETEHPRNPILPQLSVPPERWPRIDNMLAPTAGQKLRIGICWNTESTTTMNYRKCVNILELTPLFEIPDITYFSLVKPIGKNQLADAGLDVLVIDAGATDSDLLDTAALISKLDLVITIDTAVAHMAGSMGIPTWMLTPEPPYWYWNEPGEISSHYPSLRVIRQAEHLVWKDIITRIGNDLRRLKAKKSLKSQTTNALKQP